MGDNCRPTGFVSSGQVNGLTGTAFVDTQRNLVRLTVREFQRPHGTAVTMLKSDASSLANLLDRTRAVSGSVTHRLPCPNCEDRGYVLQVEKSTALYIRKCAQCNRYRNNSDAQRAAYRDAVAGQACKEGGPDKPYLVPLTAEYKDRNIRRLADLTRVCDARAVCPGKYRAMDKSEEILLLAWASEIIPGMLAFIAHWSRLHDLCPNLYPLSLCRGDWEEQFQFYQARKFNGPPGV